MRVPWGTADGDYFVLLSADHDQLVGESNESNNLFALPLSVGYALPGEGPDLVVESPSLGADHANPGEVVTSQCRIRNSGNEASPETRLKYYLSVDRTYGPEDRYLNYDAVPSLAAGADSPETANLRVPAATPEGDYYVLFVAMETDESNNVYALPFVVGAHGPRPDLWFVATSIPVTVVRPGETLAVSAEVGNQGSADAADTRLVYYLSSDALYDSDDKQLSYDKVDALAMGESHPEDAALRVSAATAAGDYFILFVLDGEGLMDEADETNNQVAQPIAVVSDDPGADKPDLVLVDASLGADWAAAGSQIPATVRVENQGATAAGTSRLKYYFSADDALDGNDQYLNYDNVDALAVGAASEEAANLSIPADCEGSYYILLVADANQDVAEQYESDNVVARPLEVGPFGDEGPIDDPDAEAPDLRVSYAAADNTEVRAGDRASLHCTVVNDGLFEAPASRVKYYLSADDLFDAGDDYVGYDNIPTLAPGAASDESATPRIPAATGHGTWYLLVVADAASEVPETYESNNVASVAIEVLVDNPDLDAPDLVADSPTLNSATGIAGRKLELGVSVHNLGTQDAPKSRVKFYLSDDDRHGASDHYLAYRSLSGLAVDEVRSLLADVRLPRLSPPGPAFLLVVVDSKKAIPEQFESSNVLAVPFTLVAASEDHPEFPYACPQSTVFADQSLLPKHTLATLNTLRLGHNNNKDMPALACIVSHFDLVGLVEVYKAQGVQELTDTLEQITGEAWGSHVSAYPVGDANGKEYYAYLWRESEVVFTESLGFFPDPDDAIKRDPYAAQFRMGNVDFTFVIFHLRYGDTLATRRLEAQQLLGVYEYFQDLNGSEADVLIGGDFNLPGDDAAFTLLGVDGLDGITDPEQMTTIGHQGLANSFDNLFYPATFTTELRLGAAHDCTMANWSEVLETVTDHIPIWAELDISSDDD